MAQSILPNWVRGRGLAVYLTVFNGAMAAGSLGWGLVAQAIGVPATLAGRRGWARAWPASLFHRVKLPTGEADLQPSQPLARALLAEPVAHDRGPVMVQVEYRIRKEDRPAFLAAMKRLSLERRRDGAYAWGMQEHTADPETDRGVVPGRILGRAPAPAPPRVARRCRPAGEALRFHIGPGRPEVHHFLAL